MSLASAYEGSIISRGGKQFVGNKFDGPVYIDHSRGSDYLQELNASDPRLDRRRILDEKDELMVDSCAWLLSQECFRSWWDSDESQILWIHGNAGKGKTMIAMFLVDEISERIQMRENETLAYFFCQSSVAGLNDGASILRGLIYFLATETTDLEEIFTKVYEKQRSASSSGRNTLYALWGMLQNMLDTCGYAQIYLVIDALDECDNDVEPLLRMLLKHNPGGGNIKILLTSRNESHIERHLQTSTISHVSLEVNESRVSNAVSFFVKRKVETLAASMCYDSDLRNEVEDYLQKNAQGTFLWVALVCKELEHVIKPYVRDTLQEFPPGLDDLYLRMLHKIREAKERRTVAHVESVLRLLAISYRLRTIEEIVPACELPADRYNDRESIKQLLKTCSSFLVLRHDVTVSFIHQSAREFFQTGKGCQIFVPGLAEEHARISRNCFGSMAAYLKKNISKVLQPDASVETFHTEYLSGALPLHAQYACLYWIDHLNSARTSSGNFDVETLNALNEFFSRYLLEWLETLSILRALPQAMVGLIKLGAIDQHPVGALITDARKFLTTFRPIIERVPVQVYISALNFSPVSSVIRERFLPSYTPLFSYAHFLDEDWNPGVRFSESFLESEDDFIIRRSDDCLLVFKTRELLLREWDLETSQIRHETSLQSMFPKVSDHNYCRFSPCGRLLAIVAEGSVCILETWSGELKSLVMRNDENELNFGVSHVEFSADAKYVAIVGELNTTFFNIETGQVIFSIDEKVGSIFRGPGIQFVPHKTLVAVGRGILRDALGLNLTMQFELWNYEESMQTFCFRDGAEQFLDFEVSGDGQLIALLTNHDLHVLQITQTESCSTLFSAPLNSFAGNAVQFLPKNDLLAILAQWNWRSTIRVVNAQNGQQINALPLAGYRNITKFVFAPDGSTFAYIDPKNQIRICEILTGDSFRSLASHEQDMGKMLFSSDSSTLVTSSGDGSLRVWDVNAAEEVEEMAEQSGPVTLSQTGETALAVSKDNQISVWSTSLGACEGTFQHHCIVSTLVELSLDGTFAAFGDVEGKVTLMTLSPLQEQISISCHSSVVRLISMSHEHALLATSGADGRSIRLWDIESGHMKREILCEEKFIFLLTLSRSSKLLAATGIDWLAVWDTATGDIVFSSKSQQHSVVDSIVFSPDDTAVAMSRGMSASVWNLEDGKYRVLPPLGENLGRIKFVRGKNWASTDQRDRRIWYTTYDEGCYDEDGPYGLSQRRGWITYRSKPLCWLPPSYRPQLFEWYVRGWDCQGRTIAMINGAGNPIFLTMNDECSDLIRAEYGVTELRPD